MEKITLDKKRSVCPIACGLDIIGDKWSLLVMRDLACGKTQFKELIDSPEKIATNILSDRLDRLRTLGIIEGYSHADSPRILYKLTKRGLELGPILAQLAGWSLKHLNGVKKILEPNFSI